MPFSRPGGSSPEDAMTKSGNCVKSIEREGNGFPKYHGRVLKFDMLSNRTVVLSHNDGFSEPFIWTGTIKEYFNIWDCD